MSFGWLFDRLAGYGNKDALILPQGKLSYSELIRLALQVKDANKIVILENGYRKESIIRFFATSIGDDVLIPFEGKANMRLVASVLNSNKILRTFMRFHKPGLILFSSGSTGESKAVLHNLERLLDKYKTSRPAFRTLAFLLFDHIGGINTMFHTLSNGGCLIIPEDRSPQAVCEAIERHSVELLPVSPSFLNMLLLSEEYRKYDLSSLKVISYGSEPMPERVLVRLSEIFPNVKFQQTYGLSELGILRSKSESNNSLWFKVGGEGYQTKIVDDILFVKAESSMVGYLNASSPFDSEGWFNTGDRVEAKDGYIRILGRESDVINVGGRKVYPSEVENVLLGMDNVADVVVYGEPNSVLGQVVGVKVQLKYTEELIGLKKRVLEYCFGKLETHKIPMKVTVMQSDQVSNRFKKVRR